MSGSPPAFLPHTRPAVAGYAEAYGAGAAMLVRRVPFDASWQRGADIGREVLRLRLIGPIQAWPNAADIVPLAFVDDRGTRTGQDVLHATVPAQRGVVGAPHGADPSTPAWVLATSTGKRSVHPPAGVRGPAGVRHRPTRPERARQAGRRSRPVTPTGPLPPDAAARRGRRRTDAAAGPDSDSDRIRRAAEELMQQGRDGSAMTETTARYRQLELAQLLHAVAHAVEAGDPLPQELLRHAANLARHVLSYPPAPLGESL